MYSLNLQSRACPRPRIDNRVFLRPLRYFNGFDKNSAVYVRNGKNMHVTPQMTRSATRSQ